MSKTPRKPAAALLIMLLIVSVLSALLLYTSRDTLSATRQLSAQQGADAAREMAKSGIERGLAMVYTLPTGEFGTGADLNPGRDASAYSLTPVYYGFRKNTATPCSEVAADAASVDGIDTDCPYTMLTIRDSVRLDGSSADRAGFAIGPELFSGNQPVHLVIKKPLAQMLYMSIDPATADGVKVNGRGKGEKVEINLNASPAILSVTGGVLAGRGLYVDPGTAFAGSTVIQKGATTIESIGVSGGVRSSMTVAIPIFNSSVRLFSGYAAGLSSKGLPQ